MTPLVNGAKWPVAEVRPVSGSFCFALLAAIGRLSGFEADPDAQAQSLSKIWCHFSPFQHQNQGGRPVLARAASLRINATIRHLAFPFREQVRRGLDGRLADVLAANGTFVRFR